MTFNFLEAALDSVTSSSRFNDHEARGTVQLHLGAVLCGKVDMLPCLGPGTAQEFCVSSNVMLQRTGRNEAQSE